MDIQYHSMRILFDNKPFFVPLKPTHVLDIGTGTGIWAVDVGDLYPDAEVIGTDLSPIQSKWVPPNVKFEIDDLDNTWTYPLDHFDLIHTRLLSGVAINNWGRFFEQCFKHLQPGGYVECQEFDLVAKSDDGSVTPDSPLTKYCDKLEEGYRKGGFFLRINISAIQTALQEAGFIDISAREFKLPIGPWPKDPKLREAGEASLVALLDGLYGLSVACFTRFLGWEVPELNVFLEEVKREWRRKAVHSYWPM
ncbi:MAG: hypothetical protein M1813_008460 [Trichoglossum hirsutum]|nr:MAG: hypothetical protein M1813_008460 [Trichoglossum hirsutum]